MDSRKRTLDDDSENATRTTKKRRRQDFIPSASFNDRQDANRHVNKPVSAHQYSHIVQQPRPQPGAGPSSPPPLAHTRPIPAQESTSVGAVSSQKIPARPPSRCSSEGWTNKSTIRSESALGASGHLTSRRGENIESQRGSMGPPMSATAHRVNRHSGSFQFPRDAPQDLRLRAWARWLVKTANPMDLADALTLSCSEQDLERRFNALHGNLDGVDVADDEEYASLSIEERIAVSLWWF
ncbi:hypothetical protein BJ912DRAFT_1067383 [Pholiota molesta]|nr:hypothetical protein BJ912DRAFT_1067383 [Pholiota molesta]